MMASFLRRAAPLAPLATYVFLPNTDHYVINNRNFVRQNNFIHCMEKDTRAPSLAPRQVARFATALENNTAIARAIHRKEDCNNSWNLATILQTYDKADEDDAIKLALDHVPERMHETTKPTYEASLIAILEAAHKVPPVTDFPIGFTFPEHLTIPRCAQYDPKPITSTEDRLQNRKWHKWSPRDLTMSEEVNVRDMEKHLKTRWADALLGILIPHVAHFKTLKMHLDVSGPAQAHAIFGTTRWGTLRQHTTAIQRALRTFPTFVPWTQEMLVRYFNHLKETQSKASVARSIWLATYFVERHAGDGNDGPAHARNIVLTKDSTCEDLAGNEPDNPDRQATTLNFYEILDLEYLSTKATHYADRVGASNFRFTLGCCARFDDTKHIKLSSLQDPEETVEFTNTQTKTTGKTKKRHTIPLIAPKIDFHEIHSQMNGLANNDLVKFFLEGPASKLPEDHLPWWTTFIKHQRDNPSTKRDYIFGIPKHDKTGFQPRYLTNQRATAWLRQLITMGYLRRGVEPPTDRIKSINLASLRPSIPDLMYTLQIPANVRENLGRWETMSSTLTYTRNHRDAVTGAWHTMRERLLGSTVAPPTLPGHTCRTGELHRTSYPNTEPDPEMTPTPAKRRRVTTPSEKVATPKTTSQPRRAKEQDFILTPKLVVNPSSNKLHWVRRLHADERNQTEGCKWDFHRNQVLLLNSVDEIARKYIGCRHCFQRYTFPSGWHLDHDLILEDIEESDYLSDSSDSDDSIEPDEEDEDDAKETDTNTPGVSSQ